MQTLDVISVNIWQILISLINLLLMFLIVKRFLFKPVKAVLAKRQQELDSRYADADTARAQAQQDRLTWEARLAEADAEAASILQQAADAAKHRSDVIISEAHQRADVIVSTAQTEAELERMRVGEEIKREIVSVSGALAEKMLEREIREEDHRALIDSFLEDIGDGND